MGKEEEWVERYIEEANYRLYCKGCGYEIYRKQLRGRLKKIAEITRGERFGLVECDNCSEINSLGMEELS